MRTVGTASRAVRVTLSGLITAALVVFGVAAATMSVDAAGAPAPQTIQPATGNCGTSNNCTQQTFATAIFGYSSIKASTSGPNYFAFETWEAAEGGNWHNTAWCNPLNTTEREPGSTPIAGNPDGVQAYRDDDGHTCWYWGIKANGDTLLNGYYGGVLTALRHPQSTDHSQCVNLADAVGDSPWGTGNFSADC
jgi:hypothetical protein